MEYNTIEEKVAALPIVPFDNSEAFQQVLFSPLFDDIFHYYMDNYSTDRIKTQSELNQRLSLYLHITNQDEELAQNINDLIYRRPCPTIEQFIEDPYYLGTISGTIYPYWKQKLIEIFNPEHPIKKVLFSGATGTGKSRTAEKACIYALYRLLCLRYPRKILNIEAQSTIAMFILSVTQKTAYQVLFQPFIELLSNMPCFQRVRQARAFENFDLNNPKCPIPWYVDKSNMTIIFPDNIILTLGSQLSNTVGYDILISECFTGNTKVWTNYGVFTFDYLNKNWKTYDNLKVKTRLPDNSIVDSLIKDVKQTNLVNNLIRLYITDDDYIECTPDHKFLLRYPKKKDPNVIWENNQGYKQAQFLTKDDDIDNKRLISFDKDILYNLYITQNKTYKEIAKIFNCKSGDVVKKYCMKFNIYKGNELRIKNGNRKFKEKYGVNNPSQVKEIQNRKKKTCLQKYGSEYFLNSQSLKSLYSIEYWNKINDKIYNTKKLHDTFNTSKPEEEIYQLLLQKYFQVERQYRSELYPFNCDFYIPSLDLYIEYNGTWEHGNKPYDENNQECINLTKKWISKNKPRYKNAIKIYTIRDPEKRKIAKENNLNWIEFFNMKEFLNWYNKGDNVEV